MFNGYFREVRTSAEHSGRDSRNAGTDGQVLELIEAGEGGDFGVEVSAEVDTLNLLALESARVVDYDGFAAIFK